MLESIVDLAIVLEWGVVVVYFIGRWLRHHRAISFCLAAMAGGWLLMGLLESHPEHERAVKFASVSLGAVLWYTIWRVEHGEKRPT